MAVPLGLPMPMRREAELIQLRAANALSMRATTAPDGIITVYERQFADSQPGMAPAGDLLPFQNTGKRDSSDSETRAAAELRELREANALSMRAITSPHGVVYERQFSDSQPGMAPSGDLLPFSNAGKRQFSDSDPGMAPSGDLLHFSNSGKRQFSDSAPGMVPTGDLLPFKNVGKRQGGGKSRMAKESE